jgi:hypothetical protein
VLVGGVSDAVLGWCSRRMRDGLGLQGTSMRLSSDHAAVILQMSPTVNFYAGDATKGQAEYTPNRTVARAG